MQGAGISKDAAAVLDLISATAWSFPRGTNQVYDVAAEVTVAKENDNPRDGARQWSGTFMIPKRRIMLSTFLGDHTPSF